MGRFKQEIIAGDFLISDQNKNLAIEALHNCLNQLEMEQKLVIQLRFWEELEVRQIAIVMTATWEYVNNLLEKSLQQLREMMILSLNQTLAASAA